MGGQEQPTIGRIIDVLVDGYYEGAWAHIRDGVLYLRFDEPAGLTTISVDLKPLMESEA